MAPKHFEDALKRLSAVESDFLSSEFLAPVVGSRGVVVRIAGVRCAMAVRPAAFEGWGVFRPASHTEAELVSTASAGERRRYLALFPTVRLVLCARSKSGGRVEGVAACAPDAHFVGDERPAEVLLAADAALFDTVVARFDGLRLWFDEVDPRADPAVAAYLRHALTDLTEPAKLARGGLTRAHRLAYAVAHARRAAQMQGYDERRLKAALGHAGADLRDFTDAGEVYRVTYRVDGRRHTSVVRKDDLTVQSAGICLSGQDRRFDLSSLVGVLREGAGAGRAVYW